MGGDRDGTQPPTPQNFLHLTPYESLEPIPKSNKNKHSRLTTSIHQSPESCALLRSIPLLVQNLLGARGVRRGCPRATPIHGATFQASPRECTATTRSPRSPSSCLLARVLPLVEAHHPPRGMNRSRISHPRLISTPATWSQSKRTGDPTSSVTSRNNDHGH